MPDISLTPEALQIAERMATEDPANSGLALRLYLEGKGCDGFYYGVTFSAPLAEDITFSQGTLTLVIDKAALEFMHGSIVSWVDDERGRGFLVENPQHKRFRGKFFKRKSWQDKLTSSSPESL